MNTVNAHHGNDPGIEAYTHGNDRFAPFASRTVRATVSVAQLPDCFDIFQASDIAPCE